MNSGGSKMVDKDSLVFTPAGLVDVLIQIDELSQYNIGISEAPDGTLQLQIGTSTYILNTEEATQVSVDEEIVDAVDEANLDAYTKLSDAGEVKLEDDPDTIQSGILKEIAKTLLLGGMVRLSAKLLRR